MKALFGSSKNSPWQTLNVSKVSETVSRFITDCSGDFQALRDLLVDEDGIMKDDEYLDGYEHNGDGAEDTREPSVSRREEEFAAKDMWQDKELIFQRSPKTPGMLPAPYSASLNGSPTTSAYLRDHEESGVMLHHTPLNSKTYESEARRHVHERVSLILSEFVDIPEGNLDEVDDSTIESNPEPGE